MRRLLDITLIDLRVNLQTRGTLMMLFFVPAIMTVLIGLAISPSQATYEIDVMRADPTDKLADDFVAQLRTEGGQTVILCELGQPTQQDTRCKLDDLKADVDLQTAARQRVESGTALAAVTIPAHFGDDLLAGKDVQLGFVSKDALGTAQVARQKIDTIITRLSGAILTARVVTEKANPGAAQRADFYDKVYQAAKTLWANTPVTVEEKTSTTTGTTVGGMGQSAPGIGAMFVMTNVLNAAAVFIQERKNWTLQRLVIMPLSRMQILGGKLLSRYLLGLITFMTMILVGTLFGVTWGDWPGVIVIVLTYTLAVTALGLALATLVKTQWQAAGIALLTTMVLAPLGGAWWPLSIVPTWMQNLGKISPIAWSQQAFNQMVFYGAHLTDVLPSVGVLLVFALVFFAFGVSRFRYE